MHTRRFTRLAIAGLLAAAGGLHLAAMPDHLQAPVAAGAFFAVIAAAQLFGAVLVATRDSPRMMVAVAAGNLAVLGLWAVSRTTGLPTGGELGLREPFGLLDGLAAAAEILVVAGGLVVVARQSATIGRRPARWQPTLALALTWLVSGGAGLALADGSGHHHAGRHAHGGPTVGGQSHDRFDLSEPPSVADTHLLPLGSDQTHEAPSLSGDRHDRSGLSHSHDGSSAGAVQPSDQCPAGHDCADHSHEPPA